ncbi:hypothetical protein LO762_01415 [Actinocorallia sp. API 0066]|uniref:hypothetical protein n=1 Tax=Actinocorallia sp. API 0066 TaxID=2896846 RepID=UPI001E31390B|nr:hypothetical protein [Actinocorallia sp. API 0066]MCD0447859.1 hypothetical protein [Actinocorallia sp. API 0066]
MTTGPGDGTGPYGGGDPPPDDRDFDEPLPDASEQLDVEDPAYSLVGDDITADPLDHGIDPPDRWSRPIRHGITDEEQRDGETLDFQLSAEVPDPVLEEINGDTPASRPNRDDEPAELAAVSVVDEDTDRDAVMHDGRPEETLQEAERAVEIEQAAEAAADGEATP